MISISYYHIWCYLVGGAAIIIPDRKIRHRVWHRVKGLSFRPETFPCTIYPDIQGLDPGHHKDELQLKEVRLTNLVPWSRARYLVSTVLSAMVWCRYLK